VLQLVIRLCVDPADDIVAGVGEEAVHLARGDACGHRVAVGGTVERRPRYRHRHLIEVAIALRPLRVVGESRSRLVVEETQIVLHQARARRSMR
jgi:hypothetical protein